MKKEKQQKRPKRTKAQRVQALKTFAVGTVYDVVGSILSVSYTHLTLPTIA